MSNPNLKCPICRDTSLNCPNKKTLGLCNYMQSKDYSNQCPVTSIIRDFSDLVAEHPNNTKTTLPLYNDYNDPDNKQPPIPFDKFLQQYKEDPACAMAMLRQTGGKSNMAVFPIDDVLKCIEPDPNIKTNQNDLVDFTSNFDYTDPNIKRNRITESEYRQDMSALEFADTSDGKRVVVIPHKPINQTDNLLKSINTNIPKDKWVDALLESVAIQLHKSWSSWFKYLLHVSTKNHDGSMTIRSSLVEQFTKRAHAEFNQIHKYDQNDIRNEATLFIELFYTSRPKPAPINEKPTAKRLEQLVNDRIKEMEFVLPQNVNESEETKCPSNKTTSFRCYNLKKSYQCGLMPPNKCPFAKEQTALKLEEPLPSILLKVNGDIFTAESEPNADIQWSIYSEAEDHMTAKTRIKVDNKVIADITIYNTITSFNNALPEEVQSVGAAIVWSGIRSARLKREQDNKK